MKYVWFCTLNQGSMYFVRKNGANHDDVGSGGGGG